MPPRALLPKDEQGSREGSASAVPKAAKRKAVSSACIPCRKRKSKCDGGLPSCSTCLAVYRTECSYDQDTDHRRKGALRKDIQSLQVKNTALDVVINSLCALPEHEALGLFNSLRRGERLDSLAEAINSGDTDKLRTLDADLSEHTGTPGSSFHTHAPSIRSKSSRSPVEGKWNETATQNVATEGFGSWFRVPQDAEFVDHLLNLYFSWSHPFSTVFSKDHFLRDMSKGETKYCSPMLVNAVLSVACHYSDRPAARNSYLPAGAPGDDFFAEAQRYADSNEEASLTTVQALAIMAIREGSAGREHMSYRLCGRAVRLALELGLHLKNASAGDSSLSPTEMEIRKLTFWGVFNLEMICCLSLGRVSSIPKNAIEIDKPANSEKLDSIVWQPYEDVSLPVSSGVIHPMKCLLFVTQLSKLSELVNDINLNLYAPRERFTPRRLAAAYNQYQAWYSDLPEIFHLQNTAMPHVVVLHMYYYMCVIHLFRPFMKVDLSAIGLYPHELYTYCATEISKLMNALRGMYGFRRTPLALSTILLSASTIHLLNLPSQTAAVMLTQGIHDLQTLSINHRFALCCIEVIKRLANQWGIVLSEDAMGLSPFRSSEPPHVMPTMSFFFTQATLSNESVDAFVAPSAGLRHDSGGIFEPSFIPHNTPILPSTNQSSAASIAAAQSMQSTTPLHTTPVPGASAMWSTFPAQQMPAPELQMQMPVADYQMMGSPVNYGYQTYPAPP